ncbi:zf-HIT domain-containing protein [Cephalotus follicularis]|uniref:Box C/D snoRNA protein 1 n=1 Tax=Cephalotus follicularis TaxID=3775 RepID=A0A1Q3BNT4_CEPFO|nr:zf-HIT domain-containing protein [Cephalotus follicularis]
MEDPKKVEVEAKKQKKNPESKPKEASNVCEECKEKPSKYKCPGCCIQTCSLPCVKAHKQRTSCSGKRNVTLFVPLSQFDDNILLSDYNMLEEVKRVAESAERTRNKLRLYPQFRLPFYLRGLRNVAASRRTKLLYLPYGMSRREKNQSRYEPRKKLISWTIEWRFHSTDVVLLEHQVREDTNLCSVIEKHLQPSPWNHKLSQFCKEQLDCLRFFIRKYPKGPKSPFQELDIRAPIRQQLANVVILEYPVIHVFLPSHACDFEIVKIAYPIPRRTEDAVKDDPKSPKGVVFREEEIEEEVGCPESRDFDLMRQEYTSPARQIPNGNRAEKALNNSSDKPLSAGVATGNSLNPSSSTREPGIFDDMEFDFDQGLIDAYSNLIAEINPDDFLDFEGEYAKEENVEEIQDLSDSWGNLLVAEELEEGEIAD